MANTVVGIRFKRVGKKYYFDPKDFKLNLYDKVVVETIRGYELGEVIEEIKEVKAEELISTLKPVHRIATNKDISQYEQNMKDIPQAIERCKFHIRKNKLEMKLLGCEFTLDRSKLIIYFNAEGRVDFRELVKDLANEFRLRIELRQVGTRDGAKFLGGIGPCGYLLCCNTFLGDFETVSIKMAKNQNLSLNPVNISGLCGKLLCCIKYENDVYTENRKELPKLNSTVITKDGKAKVIALNIINKTVRVETQEEGIKTIKVEDIVRIFDYDKKGKKVDPSETSTVEVQKEEVQKEEVKKEETPKPQNNKPQNNKPQNNKPMNKQNKNNEKNNKHKSDRQNNNKQNNEKPNNNKQKNQKKPYNKNKKPYNKNRKPNKQNKKPVEKKNDGSN